MGKLSGLSSKLPFGGGGSSSGKLSKAFRIDKQKGIMGAAVERTGDPYLDGPSSDEVSHASCCCTESIGI